MSETVCTKCDNEIIKNDEKLTICDCCGEVFHEKCADLAPSELRAIIIQKRNLLFFCSKCKNNFKKVPSIIEHLNEVLEINRKLLEENKKLQEMLSKHKDMNMEGNLNTVIQEINERQIRSSNIIVGNVQESSLNNHHARAKEDTENIKKILGNLSEEVTIKKTFRLGKFTNGKNRLIKVILSNSDEALKVLKNKKRINAPGILIFGDQTKMQKDQYLSVKSKLADLTRQGISNKKIQYINNIPTIVDVSPENKKN